MARAPPRAAQGPVEPRYERDLQYDCDGQSDEGVLLGEEVCDGLDNDCDGETDEEVITLSDPNHCGGCGVDARLRPDLGVAVRAVPRAPAWSRRARWPVGLGPRGSRLQYHCMLSRDEVLTAAVTTTAMVRSTKAVTCSVQA